MAATNTSSNQPPGSEGEIPPLKCIGPSIFVATDRDFTKTPPPLSDDPVTRLEATVESLEWHAARVEENMISMLLREAQRVRRAGTVERVQYDAHFRPVAEQQGVENDLRLEELLMHENRAEIEKILKEEFGRRDSEGGGSAGASSGVGASGAGSAGGGNLFFKEDTRDGKRPHPHHHPNPHPHSRKRRGARHPEYMDLATIRREKMFRLDVDELRHTPRSAALVHVLNLVKWGWDEQLEGHRNAVRKEVESRRANLHRQVMENPPLATVGASTSSSSMPAPPNPAPVQGDSGDPMDLD